MPTPNRESRTRAVTNSLVVATFLLAISLPPLGLLLGRDDEDTHWENRLYASAPRLEWTLESLSRLPPDLEAYFNDHFAFRTLLIRSDNVIRTVWLGASPRGGRSQPFDLLGDEVRRLSPWSPVVLGRDSWFYWFGGEMLEDYRGLRPFDTDQLNGLWCHFEERRTALARRGIPYLLVLAPEKHEIYPEYLPASIRRVHERTRLDEFLTFMKAHSELEILDLRTSLLAAKGQGAIYYRTGTHWNEYGAYVASLAITTRLQALAPRFSPVALPPFEIHRRAGPPIAALTDMFGIADQFDDEVVELVPVDGAGGGDWLIREYAREFEFGSSSTRGSAASGAPRVVMLHDSFTPSHLGDFLSRHFERIDFQWTLTVNVKQIDRLRPDLVIEERATRFLSNRLPALTAAQARCVRERHDGKEDRSDDGAS